MGCNVLSCHALSCSAVLCCVILCYIMRARMHRSVEHATLNLDICFCSPSRACWLLAASHLQAISQSRTSSRRIVGLRFSSMSCRQEWTCCMWPYRLLRDYPSTSGVLALLSFEYS